MNSQRPGALVMVAVLALVFACDTGINQLPPIDEPEDETPTEYVISAWLGSEYRAMDSGSILARADLQSVTHLALFPVEYNWPDSQPIVSVPFDSDGYVEFTWQPEELDQRLLRSKYVFALLNMDATQHEQFVAVLGMPDTDGEELLEIPLADLAGDLALGTIAPSEKRFHAHATANVADIAETTGASPEFLRLRAALDDALTCVRAGYINDDGFSGEMFLGWTVPIDEVLGQWGTPGDWKDYEYSVNFSVPLGVFAPEAVVAHSIVPALTPPANVWIRHVIDGETVSAWNIGPNNPVTSLNPDDPSLFWFTGPDVANPVYTNESYYQQIWYFDYGYSWLEFSNALGFAPPYSFRGPLPDGDWTITALGSTNVLARRDFGLVDPVRPDGIIDIPVPVIRVIQTTDEYGIAILESIEVRWYLSDASGVFQPIENLQAFIESEYWIQIAAYSNSGSGQVHTSQLAAAEGDTVRVEAGRFSPYTISMDGLRVSISCYPYGQVYRYRWK